MQQMQGQYRDEYAQQGQHKEQQYGRAWSESGLEQGSQSGAAAEFGGRGAVPRVAQSAASVSSLGDGYEQEEAPAAYARGPLEHGGGRWRRSRRLR